MRLIVSFLSIGMTAACVASPAYPLQKPPRPSLREALSIADKRVNKQPGVDNYQCYTAYVSDCPQAWIMKYANAAGENRGALIVLTEGEAGESGSSPPKANPKADKQGQNKVHAVSLREALSIVDKMLTTQGDNKNYHCLAARYNEGGWGMEYANQKGKELWVGLLLKDKSASLLYHKDFRIKYKMVKFSWKVDSVEVKSVLTRDTKKK